MLEMYQNGVRVFCLPDDACCKLDENKRSSLKLEECPNGKEYCNGNCWYYSEDPEDRYCEYLEPDEYGDICHAGDDTECPELFENKCSAKYDIHGNSLNEMAEDERLRGEH